MNSIKGKFRGRGPQKDLTRVNAMIREEKVRLVGEAGEQLGVVPTREALEKAQDLGLDLVEVAAKADPPVCRLMDYGKFKYQQSKKAHESKKKQTVIQVKEIKFRTRTDTHDMEFKVKNVIKFLDQGNKVKISIMFRGREMAHRDLGLVVLNKVKEMVVEHGVVEAQPKLEGRNLMMVLGPVAKKPA